MWGGVWGMAFLARRENMCYMAADLVRFGELERPRTIK